MKTVNSNTAQLLGIRIRELRQLSKTTQEELAHRADISTQHLGTIERGEQNPTLSTVTAIADALGIPLYLLLCESLLTYDEPLTPAWQKLFCEEFRELPTPIQKVFRDGVHQLHSYFH